jgi:hypothetical protein
VNSLAALGGRRASQSSLASTAPESSSNLARFSGSKTSTPPPFSFVLVVRRTDEL